MNKFIPVCVAIILGLVAIASGLKCYRCEHAKDSSGTVYGDPDCDNNLGPKFEVDCGPDYSFVGPTSKISGTQNIADLIVSLLPQKGDKPLTQALSPKASIPHCWKGIGKQGDAELVMRDCYLHYESIKNKCESDTIDGVKATVCICNKELCNGASSLKTLFILPIMGVLAYSLF